MTMLDEAVRAKGVAPTPLAPELLFRSCDPSTLTFILTDELAELNEIVGQARAVDAIQFGIGIRREGYNLFALGPHGTGKRSVILRFLAQRARSEQTPPEWCYVHNFEDPQAPEVLQVPPGVGRQLRVDMERLVEELRATIPSVFESEGYRDRKKLIEDDVRQRQESALEEIRRLATEKGLAVVESESGLIFAQLTEEGELLKQDEFHRLPEEQRQKIQEEINAIQAQLQEVMRLAPQWEREARERLRNLNRESTTSAVSHLISEIRRRYEGLPNVLDHLGRVEQDVIENASEFLPAKSNALSAVFGMGDAGAAKGATFSRRYRVNLLVDQSDNGGAPLVYEDHPSFQNLVGEIEYISQLGSLVTDFNLIRPGALHRANGGYLVLEAEKILTQPYAWDALKRSLRGDEIRVEPLGRTLGMLSTVSLEPEPIPLDLKVVLIGERHLYYLLCEMDREFSEFFKVAVDFESDMDRSPESEKLYARIIATLVRKENLMPFDRGAVARLIEQSSRLAENSEKLSMHMVSLTDMLCEADHWAGERGATIVESGDVQRAIDAGIRRSDRSRERIQEEIERGTLLIDTRGSVVGQVNGMSVHQLGQFSFGRPSRITATVRLGSGEVIDIDREVELGGPIHSKGVFILSGFLGGRFAIDRPLSLSASLVFEQSYGGVEGDSASSAELCVMLSALSGVPIRQSIAVTGSVNQHGQIQAVGGVNQKIEGFFDVCCVRGLTGDQGVIIPAANTRHLMLRAEIVNAVREGNFRVWAVETIDQSIEILTGVAAGERDERGEFPLGSVNRRVEDRLLHLAEERSSFGASKRPPAGS